MNKGFNLNFDTRVTKGEKEVSKRRAAIFFRLKQGEFIAFADGKDRKVQFKLQNIKRELPKIINQYSESELTQNFERIYEEVKSIFSK